MANGLAVNDSRKSSQRRTTRYVKRLSNTMRRTDHKMLHDGRRILSYMDDASRAGPGRGAFKRAATASALAVLDVAIKWHGAPLSILSDRVSTFYANEAGGRERDEGESKGASGSWAYAMSRRARGARRPTAAEAVARRAGAQAAPVRGVVGRPHDPQCGRAGGRP